MQILHIHRYLTQNILGCINATKEVAQIKKKGSAVCSENGFFVREKLRT